MKEIIVHSGMPKNGSSAIQVSLAQNCERLRELSVEYFKVGAFLEGKSGGITSGNGGQLARSLLSQNHEAYLSDPNGDHIKAFLKCVDKSKCEYGVLSSEFFTNIPESSVSLLKRALDQRGIRLKFVYYVRRQDAFLISGYMQRVKRHHCTKLPQEHVALMYPRLGFLKYYSYSKGLEAVLGSGNVIVRNFDVCKRHSRGLTADFLEVLGVDQERIFLPNKVVNVSPSAREIKAILMLNKFRPPVSLIDQLVKDSPMFSGREQEEGVSILEPSFRCEILEFFQNENDQLNSEFLPDGHQLDSVVPDDFVDLSSLKLEPEDVVEIFGSMVVALNKKLLDAKYYSENI